jgi:hypothetical protein
MVQQANAAAAGTVYGPVSSFAIAFIGQQIRAVKGLSGLWSVTPWDAPLLGAVAEERTRQIPGIPGAPTEAEVAAWTAYIKQPGASLTEWTARILPMVRGGGAAAGGGWLEQELIPGVKNLWLIVGSGGFLLLAMAAKRRRR